MNPIVCLRWIVAGFVFFGLVQPVNAEKIRIISTNDMHSYLRPVYYRTQDEPRPWGIQAVEGDFLQKSRIEGKIGGMAYAASVIKSLREGREDSTLLVDCGDTWHGSGLSAFDRGVSMVKIMNAMKYDAMAPGNWEFIYDREHFLDLVEQSEYSVVAFNLNDKEWGDPVLDQYVIKEVGGLRVAVVGMTYPWTALTSAVTGAAQWWKFGIQKDEAQELITQIRDEEDPDLVLFISHGGLGYDQKFARQVDGIDVLASGHTHNAIFDPIIWNNTIIYEAGAHAEYVSALDLEIKDKKVVSYDYQLVKVNQSHIKPDPEIQKLVDQAYAPHAQKLGEVIGVSEGVFYRRDYWQSTLGNLITDALRDRMGTDISLFPAWRYGATLMPGEITVENIYNIVPTGGPISTFSMSGKQVKMLLENIINGVAGADPFARVGGDMIRFSGLKLQYDLDNKRGERIVSLTLTDGTPVDDDEKYTVASVSTRFQNNPLFGATDVVNTDRLFAEELIAYIKAKNPIKAALDDRIGPRREEATSLAQQ